MNRRQSWVLGIIPVLSALSSFIIGSDHGGVAGVMYTLLFPALILGSYFLFLFRERGSARASQRRELGYVLGIGAPIAMLVWSITRFFA